MTTPDHTRSVQVDPLVLTMPAGPGQRIGALVVDVFVPVALAALAVLMFAMGNPVVGWLFVLATVAAIAAGFTMLAETGQSLGRIAAGTRTVERSTGAAAGASLLASLITRRLGTFDVNRGRDPFTAALAPFVFPARERVPATAARSTLAPVVELDSGQRFSLDSPLVLGRNPSAPTDAPADVYRWADLSRTVSKSHARLEWDGRRVWVTDLGSTNGTALLADGAPQPLIAFQRTPLPASATLELGDRIVTVTVPE